MFRPTSRMDSSIWNSAKPKKPADRHFSNQQQLAVAESSPSQDAIHAHLILLQQLPMLAELDVSATLQQHLRHGMLKQCLTCNML